MKKFKKILLTISPLAASFAIPLMSASCGSKGTSETNFKKETLDYINEVKTKTASLKDKHFYKSEYENFIKNLDDLQKEASVESENNYFFIKQKVEEAYDKFIGTGIKKCKSWLAGLKWGFIEQIKAHIWILSKSSESKEIITIIENQLKEIENIRNKGASELSSIMTDEEMDKFMKTNSFPFEKFDIKKATLLPLYKTYWETTGPKELQDLENIINTITKVNLSRLKKQIEETKTELSKTFPTDIHRAVQKTAKIKSKIEHYTFELNKKENEARSELTELIQTAEATITNLVDTAQDQIQKLIVKSKKAVEDEITTIDDLVTLINDIKNILDDRTNYVSKKIPHYV